MTLFMGAASERISFPPGIPCERRPIHILVFHTMSTHVHTFLGMSLDATNRAIRKDCDCEKNRSEGTKKWKVGGRVEVARTRLHKLLIAFGDVANQYGLDSFSYPLGLELATASPSRHLPVY